MFGTDVFVFELVGFLERIFEDSIEPGTDIDFRLSLNLRQLGHRSGEIARERLQVHAEFLKNRQNDAFFLLDQREQKMLGGNLGVAVFLRMSLCRLKGLLALQCQLVKTNHINLLRDTDLLRLCLLLFRKRDLEYAVFVFCSSLLFVLYCMEDDRLAACAGRPPDSTASPRC